MLVLKHFGFESLELQKSDFTNPDNIIQLGIIPNRINLITRISGITFDEAYKNKVTGKLGTENVYFISPQDLLKNKKAANRVKDLSDIEVLLKFINHNNNDKTN